MTSNTAVIRLKCNRSSQATRGVRRKLTTRASASGMKTSRPKYKAATSSTIVINVSDCEGFGESSVPTKYSLHSPTGNCQFSCSFSMTRKSRHKDHAKALSAHSSPFFDRDYL